MSEVVPGRFTRPETKMKVGTMTIVLMILLYLLVCTLSVSCTHHHHHGHHHHHHHKKHHHSSSESSASDELTQQLLENIKEGNYVMEKAEDVPATAADTKSGDKPNTKSGDKPQHEEYNTGSQDYISSGGDTRSSYYSDSSHSSSQEHEHVLSIYITTQVRVAYTDTNGKKTIVESRVRIKIPLKRGRRWKRDHLAMEPVTMN